MCKKERRDAGEGFGCYRCEGMTDRIHSVWCVNSDFCEAKYGDGEYDRPR